jgi:hypothetical protein
MKPKLSLLLVFPLFLIFSCSKDWEDHYNNNPVTIDQNVWDAMQNDSEISEFVQILKDIQYDTLFLSDISYTIFVPTNAALDVYKSENNVERSLVDYLLTPHFIQSGDVVGKRYIQTLSEKFALFEKNGSELKMDGILLTKESPLFKNGKYFKMEKVAEPLPNLYEYFAVNAPLLKDYIDSQDSIILDKENSRPIGFDENGKTVFDSVIINYNEFEELFFPVSKEFRNQRATIIYPRKEEYEDALTLMAQEMNIPGYVDYRDIPTDWQSNVLVPHLLAQGIFDNLREPHEFVWESEEEPLILKNILGDSIEIFYTPVEKELCSNGYTYSYENFQIPELLYSEGNIFEMEWLLESTGINRYAWIESVKVESDQFFLPLKEFNSKASNDTVLNVLFQKGYDGNFSLEFNTDVVFPRKYLMVVKTIMHIGGIYDIYVNDELVRTFDYFDFFQYREVIPSVIPGKRYFPEGIFNKFDMWVENLDAYGKAKIRFEYKGPGLIFSNGLIIDNIELIPAESL